MINRFNYTQRKKLPRENFNFWWEKSTGNDDTLSFGAEVNITDDMGLDPAAEVVVEAYSGPAVLRFGFGTVASIQIPDDRRLSIFPPGTKPLFRVKVVNPTDERKPLLAWAVQISPLTEEELQGGKRSILPVETLDLGQQVWNLRFEGGNQPILQLNSQIQEPRDITLLAKESEFIALVYPAVVRQILQHLLLGEEADTVEPDHDWLKYGGTLAGRPAPAKDDNDFSDDEAFQRDVDEWITDAVRGFCEQNTARDAFVRHRKEIEENVHD